MRRRASRARRRKTSPIAEVRRYYRTILPFYERESAGRGDLVFWASLCREWSPASVLEVGCGVGRVTRALSAAERVVGLDLSLEMLGRASRNLVDRPVRLIAADARRFAFDVAFDLIVAPDDPISHWTHAIDRRAMLCCVARHLSADGHFVLEGLYRPERRRIERAARPIGPGGELSVRETWDPIGGDDLWIARYSYLVGRGQPLREVEASFRARSWKPSELRRLLRSCGLVIEEIWGDFDRTPFTARSRRMLVVTRRARSRAR